MSLRITLLMSFLLISSFALCQHKANALVLELGGQGLVWSLNFERQSQSGWLARGGVGWVPNEFVLPISAGKLFGDGPHYFEAGLGVTARFMNGQFRAHSNDELLTYKTDLFLTGFLGYRYQSEEKRWFYRAGAVPIWNFYASYSEEFAFVPWLGLSAGYRL